jgi:hypothetical protein
MVRHIYFTPIPDSHKRVAIYQVLILLMRRPMASQNSTPQTLSSWNCSAQQQFPRSILTPLPRTRDLSTTLMWALLKLITCHIPARMPTILAYQSHPFLRAPCLTIPHTLFHLHRALRRETTNPHLQRAIMFPTFLRRKSLGSSLAGTSPPVATEPLASSLILRERIIRVPCPRLRSIPLPMSNSLILPTFICLHRRPNFKHRMVYLHPIFLLSPHSQRRSPSLRHHRSSCTSVILRTLCLPCRFPSILLEYPCQRQDITGPCPLSPLHTLTPTNILFLSLSRPRPQRTSPLKGRSRLLHLTRNLRLHLVRTSGTPRHLNKMVHKNRLTKRASVHVVIVA